MSNLPSIALDVQISMLEWLASYRGQEYMEAEEAILTKEGYLKSRSGTTFAHNIPVALANSETFAVTGEIVELLTHASKTIPDFVLDPTDLPSQGGFIYLDDPGLVIIDRGDLPVVVRALQWVPMGNGRSLSGVAFVLYTDPRDPRDSGNGPDSKLWQIDQVMRAKGEAAPFYPMWGASWWFGDKMSEAVGRTLSGQEVNDTQAFVMAFLRFIQEPFIDSSPQLADRPTRRRVERSKANLTPHTRVIALRRRELGAPQGDPGEHKVVNWRNRWIVGGHWRNQWYPSQNRHAPIWIAPYPKGPEDKPLLVKDRIFKVER